MRPRRRRNRGTKRPGTGRVARLTVDGADRGRLFHARTVAERSRGLLGVDGICIISHGSSGERAMLNAITLGDEMSRSGLVAEIAAAFANAE